MMTGKSLLIAVALVLPAALPPTAAAAVYSPAPPPVFPGRSWARVAPADVGLNETKLDAFRDFLGPESHGVVGLCPPPPPSPSPACSCQFLTHIDDRLVVSR